MFLTSCEYVLGLLSVSSSVLGLGKAVRVNGRTVSIYFDINQEERTYAHDQAPITRVKFASGDEIKTQDKRAIIVTTVKEQDGLFLYSGECGEEHITILETELDLNLSLIHI